MASRKIYFTDEEFQSELEAFQNDEEKLFIALSERNSLQDCQYIALDREDAYELIEEIATQFGWLSTDKNEQGLRTWAEE